MVDQILAAAGLSMWLLAMVILIRRLSLLERRQARLEEALGITPTVKHLARLAKPLQRAGG